MVKALLSVKPEYAEKILSGEERRSMSSAVGYSNVRMWISSSSMRPDRNAGLWPRYG